MQTRSRRPHGIRSRKVSISVSEDDLAVLAARAKRLHRDNISAVIHEIAETLRREEAMDGLLTMLGGDRVTDQEVRKLREELAAAGLRNPRRQRRRKAA